MSELDMTPVQEVDLTVELKTVGSRYSSVYRPKSLMAVFLNYSISVDLKLQQPFQTRRHILRRHRLVPLALQLLDAHNHVLCTILQERYRRSDARSTIGTQENEEVWHVLRSQSNVGLRDVIIPLLLKVCAIFPDYWKVLFVPVVSLY